MTGSRDVESRTADARRAMLAELLRTRARQTRDRGAGGTPLSENQRGMWFLNQLAPTSAAYNIAFAVSILSPLDIEALRAALQSLVDRHAILRTTYRLEAGVPVQVVNAAQPIDFACVDAARWDDGELRRRVAAATQEPFDLESGPVSRTRLFARSDGTHVLLLVFQHIAFDGWSTWLLLDELRSAYQRAAAGDRTVPPPPAADYRDFGRWQAELLVSERGQRARRYWHENLAGELPILSLPVDRQRTEVPLGRVGASAFFALSPDAVDQARALARTESATLYMVLLAAYHVLLHRYTGQDIIMVGSPVSGRTSAEFADVVGCFVNSVVIRGDLGGTPTFRAFLRQIRQTVLGALEHQDYPFRRLAEELRPSRDLRVPLLFQTDLAMHRPHRFSELATIFLGHARVDRGPIRFGDLQIEHYQVHQPGGQLDLSVEMLEQGRDVVGTFQYDPALFDRETVERMMRHYQLLVERLVADPDAPVSTVSLLTADERRLMVVDWNATDAPFPADRCFADLFEAQVGRTPDAVAVVADEGTLTYRELDARAQRLTGRLVAAGVGRDRVVALLGDRSLDFLTWILAVFKVGGAYLPLDPRHPAARHASILSGSGAVLVLVDDDHVDVLDAALAAMNGPVRPATLRRRELHAAAAEAGPIESEGRPADLAYVIYTSGSTGVPKGAMVEQLGMVNHLYAKIRDLGLTGGDTVAQTASQCFDISVWQFLAPLLVGGRVRIVSDDVAHDAPQLLDLVEREGVSVIEVVPSVLATAFAEGTGLTPSRWTLARLRWLIVTGEAAPPALCRRWLQTYPRTGLMNGYGPTECSDDVTHHVMTEPLPADATQVPIGRPIANMRIYVVDQALTPVPIGVPGELCVGGIGVGRGYLGDPARTAQAFVADPFSDRPGARLYRTGDLARWRADGTLEFLGRIDHQVKIRGFRIELGEIEAVLGRHPDVRETVVLAREDARGERRLVAYVVTGAGGPPPAELRQFLGRSLPDYMVPDTIVPLPALPLTPNGKIDRRALPVPAPMSADRQATYVAPRSEAERVVADIYADVLGLDKVGIQDGFFDLGGHSLTATRAIARIRETFGVQVQVRTIFEIVTVAAMAEHVERLRDGGREELVL
jgi:amino acid adenylation domain-containing protein